MKILKLTQNSDEWLQWRLGKITGSKAKSVQPLSRGNDRTPAGVWTLLAERVADNAGGEAPIERGHRLENVALARLAAEFELNIDTEPGVWVSDIDDDITISPDGAENTELPTYAAEVKCLASARHLMYIVKDIIAKGKDGYRAIDSIPNEYGSAYREQVVQYFVVNEKLQKLYFVLFDDRIALNGYDFYVIEINRSDIEDEIKAQTESQQQVISMVNNLIAALDDGKKVLDFGFVREGKNEREKVEAIR